MAELKSAQLKLWIYDGELIGGMSVDPQYTLTKTVLAGDTTVTFEISELVKDYIEIEFDGSYEDLKQTRWVWANVTRTYDTDPETTDTYDQFFLAFRGYGELVDEINPELSKDLMISNDVIYTMCDEPITVPFYTGEGGATKIKYIQDQTELDSVVLGSADRYTVAQDVRLNPPAFDVVKIDKTLSTSVSPDDSSSVNEVPVDANKITFTTEGGVEKTIEIKCIDECKNTPYKISFINKFGVMQDIWFFARRKDSMTTQREQYKKSTLKIGDGNAAYDVSDHQRVYLENQGRDVITMNTGFIDESYNEVIKQLLISEYVYIHDINRRSPSNPRYDLAVPINVVTNSLEVKTQQYDRLINYELQFEADSQIVQSIR